MEFGFSDLPVPHGSGDKWHIKAPARKFLKLENISINHRANRSKQQSKPGLKALFRSEEAELTLHHLFATRQVPMVQHSCPPSEQMRREDKHCSTPIFPEIPFARQEKTPKSVQINPICWLSHRPKSQMQIYCNQKGTNAEFLLHPSLSSMPFLSIILTHHLLALFIL